MSENDVIAEYVKEKYPEILETMDFAVYKFGAAVRETRDKLVEAIRKIDFSGLNKAVHEVAEAAKAAELPGFTQDDCAGCKHENSTDIIEYWKFCNICKRGKNDEYEREYHEDLYEARADKE